jgi:hypothetical protein
MSIIRKPYPLPHLPLQSATDMWKDEGPLLLLPPFDFTHWMSGVADEVDLILARVTAVGDGSAGRSMCAVVGLAENEQYEIGPVYMTTYLMKGLGVLENRDIVRLEPWTGVVPRGTRIVVAHDSALVADLGLDIFEALQRTIMDWPVLERGASLALVFEEAGGLIVDVSVVSVAGEDGECDVVRLGGEVELDIIGPDADAATATSVEESMPAIQAVEATAADMEESMPAITAVEELVAPAPAPTAAQVYVETAAERRQAVRASWLARFAGSGNNA